MTRLWRDRYIYSICLIAVACVGGCESGEEPNAPPALREAGRPGPGGGPGNVPPSREIQRIMIKLNKGPNSLTTLIDSGLKAEKPAWETIAPQTKEFAQLAAELGKHDPPKGSKESWSKLCAEYLGLASELEKAAQAKDKAAATAAQGDLASSCMACHRQHRGGPGGGGGGAMGPPGGGPPGRRRGSGPPGSPGGAPPPRVPTGDAPPSEAPDPPK
jgi:hypothetical protein